MLSVTIVGIGRVGGALALSLPPNKYRVERLVSRTDSHDAIPPGLVSPSGPEIVSFDELERVAGDIVFITTQDACIRDAAELLAGLVSAGTLVFHTSGALDSSILGGLRENGCDVGSIHPLVSISRAEFGPDRFRGSYFCVEGDERAVTAGTELVADIGGIPFSIDTRFKTLYHAAAVTACGHLVALFDAAVEMMTRCGLEPERSKEILLPLVLSTVRNLEEQSPSAALTGTFARADIETFTRHLTSLNENVSDELLEIYLLLGERSLQLAARQGVSSERIDTLRTKVAIAKSKLKW